MSEPTNATEIPSAEAEIEDDPAQLIDWLIVEHMQGEDNGTTRDQLRWALEKLIDERVAKALGKKECRTTWHSPT